MCSLSYCHHTTTRHRARCARDTQPMTRIHKTHLRFVTKRDSVTPSPEVNSRRSVASRQNRLARNNLYVKVSPDTNSQDACSFPHQKTQSPGPNRESKKQHLLTTPQDMLACNQLHSSRQSLLHTLCSKTKKNENNGFIQFQQFHTMRPIDTHLTAGWQPSLRQ